MAITKVRFFAAELGCEPAHHLTVAGRMGEIEGESSSAYRAQKPRPGCPARRGFATSATLADFSRARDSQITFSVTHGWSAFWRGRPWFAERRIGETSLAVGSSRFWIGWVTRHGDKCARSTCRD